MTDDKDPRRYAVDAYIRITKDRRTLEQSLETLRGFNSLPARDKAFARLLSRCLRGTRPLRGFCSRPVSGAWARRRRCSTVF